MRKSIFYLIGALIMVGCVPTNQNPKYLFSSGSYTLHSGTEKKKAYLTIEDDRIRVFDIDSSGKYDTSRSSLIFLSDARAGLPKQYSFIKYSFDLDIVSIPLKFRPSLAYFPAQLNTSLNGGIFIGRRADVYRLYRRKNELDIQTSTLQHYGLSFGAFTGIGSAAMNPWVTRNEIQTEYDAVVIPLGLNTLLAYNNLTFGAAVGWDHMLSRDRKFWIYRGKPWLGLTVGLNLN